MGSIVNPNCIIAARLEVVIIDCFFHWIIVGGVLLGRYIKIVAFTSLFLGNIEKKDTSSVVAGATTEDR